VRSNDIRKVITRKTLLTELARRDVRTLEQLAAMTVDELQSVPGIGAKTAPRIRASAQAYLTDAPVWFSTVPQSIRKPGAILDVRIDPDTLPQIPWGFCLSSPAHEKHYLIDVPEMTLSTHLHLPDGRMVGLVPRFHNAWMDVRDLAFGNGWTVYYWGKAILKHLNETATPKVRKDLKLHMVDLHKIFVDAVALPTKSTGLVETAKYLGYTGWTSEDKPYIAHIAYLHWRRNPDRLDSLQDALDTMARNTDAISHIWWWMSSWYRASN
jgi:predicted RecB family nuclease